ncbi:MAG: helix-turn-helix domain-containing protein [Candidatus Parvarchaeota archaeon]
MTAEQIKYLLQASNTLQILLNAKVSFKNENESDIINIQYTADDIDDISPERLENFKLASFIKLNYSRFDDRVIKLDASIYIGNNSEQLPTVEVTAQKYKVSKSTIYRWLKQKKLQAIRIGHKLFILDKMEEEKV